jgi:transposase-like protein
MYSYEDRIKAVRLYLKLGKRLGVTIRQLGYPTKNTLIDWYREFIDKQALRDGYTRSPGTAPCCITLAAAACRGC